jgi:ligand-binding SRPBCC domain-containing protein
VLAAAEAAGRAPGELIWTWRSLKLAVIMLTGVMTVVFDTTIANVAISAFTEMPARR